jgi:ABC-2 type transport system ATP-binding protein
MLQPTTTADAILQVRNMTKRYDDFVLDRFNLTLPKGYILGLIGPNGAGKTTCIKLLLGAIRSDRGEINWFGENSGSPRSATKGRIGFVHETPPMYNHVRVREFGKIIGLFYPEWNERLFTETVQRFGLPLKKKAGSLSRGMRTKLALATALSHNAEILILDEPTSGLDPVFRRELLQEFREYIQNGERSVLFSTHITSDLEHIADYIVYLRDGRVRLDESVETLRDNWKLVRGALDDLTDEIRAVLNGVIVDTYSFSGLTSRPKLVTEFSKGRLEFEPVTFEDIVIFLEEEHD